MTPVWGLDMVGPFQMSPCKKTHLLVDIDKFTKWVEVMPISNNALNQLGKHQNIILGII